MSLHDAYARTTPFELAFPDGEAVTRLLAEIGEEAQGRGTDPANPQAFMTMGSVGAFIRGLQGPDAPPEAIHQYGALVYHGVHFEAAGRPLYVLGAATSRYLVEGSPGGEPVPPAPSGYLQLPQHLFWSTSQEGDAPESVDGFFWTVSDLAVLHCLLVTGVRPDRPGFGTVPVPEAPIADAGSWLDASGRPDGEDFTSDLPGAELDGLYAIETAGEVLKLVARFFAYTARVPASLVPGERPDAEGLVPAPSAIEHQRVTLHA